MTRYNDPFYFAIPVAETTYTLRQAREHIARRFDLTGEVELVRSDDQMRLYRLHHSAAR